MHAQSTQNFKGALNELLQKKGLPLPHITFTQESEGWRCVCQYSAQQAFTAIAFSKKDAEQSVCRKILAEVFKDAQAVQHLRGATGEAQQNYQSAPKNLIDDEYDFDEDFGVSNNNNNNEKDGVLGQGAAAGGIGAMLRAQIHSVQDLIDLVVDQSLDSLYIVDRENVNWWDVQLQGKIVTIVHASNVQHVQHGYYMLCPGPQMPDASDNFIAFVCGALCFGVPVNSSALQKIYIVTNDHFANNVSHFDPNKITFYDPKQQNATPAKWAQHFSDGPFEEPTRLTTEQRAEHITGIVNKIKSGTLGLGDVQ